MVLLHHHRMSSAHQFFVPLYDKYTLVKTMKCNNSSDKGRPQKLTEGGCQLLKYVLQKKIISFKSPNSENVQTGSNLMD